MQKQEHNSGGQICVKESKIIRGALVVNVTILWGGSEYVRGRRAVGRGAGGAARGTEGPTSRLGGRSGARVG